MRIALACLAAALLALSAAAGKKDTFTLSIEMEAKCSLGYCSDWSGRFRASGTLSGSGPASAPHNQFTGDETIELVGKKGTITVVVENIEVVGGGSVGWSETELTGTFRVLAATGSYAGLEGSGTATGTAQHKGKGPWSPSWKDVQSWQLVSG